MVTDFLPEINLDRCTGCGRCVRVCPNAVLALIDHLAAVCRPDRCDYSGLCEWICPTGAISLVYEIVKIRPDREQNGARC